MTRAWVAVLALLLTACADPAPRSDRALVVVSAPLTAQPWIGRFIERGARLAAQELGSGVVEVKVLDNEGSPQRAVSIARRAIEDGAVALLTDGVGARSVAAVTDPAHLPVLILFEGGSSLIDPKAAPTLFRIAPANRYLCRRLADYLADVRRGAPVAVVSDDSGYGREGADQVVADLRHNEVRVASVQTVPQRARGVAAQVRAARRSGARVLVIWANAPAIAAVVREARSTGWEVPVYTGPTGADPLVRQQLADRPAWVDGLVFVSFRITSEVGPEPFAAYRRAYEKRFGPDRVGVRDVVSPPDWSTYGYDAVKLVMAAVERAGTRDRSEVLDALQQVSITGANGDERGFGPDDREGVSPDDMYFARFRGLRFAPVTDDKLSTNLPAVAQ
jgi:ABC-type branched-subunit amino acid transport system substrate-binding protein